MAIEFEFYKNPQQEEADEEPSYHPRVVNAQQINTQQLAKEIHAATTFGKAEVEAVLMELSRCMGNHLCQGERVHLDGIGYFQITLQATETIHSTTARANNVKLKGVSFQIDKELKGIYNNCTLQRSKNKVHSASLSDEEIDQKLTSFFSTHTILTRAEMQSICHFTQSMAAKQIRKRKEQGCLLNIGKPTQPIYIPAPGYYGKALS